MFNGLSVHSENLEGMIVEDNANYTSYIGFKHNKDLDGPNPFNGFMYEVGVSNYAIDLGTLFSSSCSASSSSYTCGVCPVDGVCLSRCSISEYPSDEDCGTCDESCSTGCVRSQNCHLCFDFHCSTCSTFSEDSCTECEESAELNSDNCACGLNFNGDPFLRDSLPSPCCAARCATCS